RRGAARRAGPARRRAAALRPARRAADRIARCPPHRLTADLVVAFPRRRVRLTERSTMTSVDAITATGLQSRSTVPPSTQKKTLDSEVFLKLLVTQLSNQDPSSPMNTNEMIAQTTQLASMEQLTQLTTMTSESFALSMRHTAAVLMGREAQYTDADGVTQTGTVTAVSFAGPVPQVTIGGRSVPLDALSGLTLSS